MKNYRWLNQNNKGITLIALVLTIIILIILAGISINLILGDNGLLGKAKDAREQQTIESIREKLDIVKGSDYLEQEGNNNIDTYFETLEKEKIEPYTVTNRQKMTDVIGNVEVDNKYSYIVKIENNKNIKIEYEGKVGEIVREPDEVTITITGEKEQSTLPVALSTNIKVNGQDATSGKYVINNTEEVLGTDDNSYTEEIIDGNINVTLEQANSYYIHTLITDKYGRKQETIKGPITISAKYHAHTGSSSSGGGCYTSYHAATKTKCGHWDFVSGDGSSTSGCWNTFRCSGCGRKETTWCVADSNGSGWGMGDHYKETSAYYSVACGKNTSTIEKYIIEY